MCSAVKEFFRIWQTAASPPDIFMDNQYIVTQDTDSGSGRVEYLVCAVEGIQWRRHVQ